MLYILKGGAGVPFTPLFDVVSPFYALSGHVGTAS